MELQERICPICGARKIEDRGNGQYYCPTCGNAIRENVGIVSRVEDTLKSPRRTKSGEEDVVAISDGYNKKLHKKRLELLETLKAVERLKAQNSKPAPNSATIATAKSTSPKSSFTSSTSASKKTATPAVPTDTSPTNTRTNTSRTNTRTNTNSAYQPKYQPTYQSKDKYHWWKEAHWLHVLYLLLCMASMVVGNIFNLPNYVLLIANFVELLLFFALFNNRSGDNDEEYHLAVIIILVLLSVVMTILSVVYIERLLPCLQRLRAMVNNGTASRDYYKGALTEVRIVLIIGMIVLTIGMVVGVSECDKRIPSVTLPLAMIGGVIIFLYILNFSLWTEMPKNGNEPYSYSGLSTLIGSVIIPLPSIGYLFVNYFIGNKASESD